MVQKDTILLLQKCNSGTQMAIYSIKEIQETIKDPKLQELLLTSKAHHAALGDRIHIHLQKCGVKTKDPGSIAKAMSWLKTNIKLIFNDSDYICAGLITDGCHMGTKTIQHHLNHHPAADKEAKQMAEELICMEEMLANTLKPYL